MELDAELFEQVVAALGPAQDEAVPNGVAEKRRDRRIAVTADVGMIPFGVASAKPRTVKLRSLSRSGAAVVDGQTRQGGEKVVLYLPRAGGGTIALVCVVMNARLSGGGFRIGVKFLDHAERAQRGPAGGITALRAMEVLDALAKRRTIPGARGASAKATAPQPPVELNAKALLSAYGDGRTGPPRFVMVKEIAADGTVCVIQPAAPRPGAQFVLQIPREQGRPLTLMCTAGESRLRDDGNYRVAARFEVWQGVLRRGADADADADAGADADANNLLGKLRRWFAA